MLLFHGIEDHDLHSRSYWQLSYPSEPRLFENRKPYSRVRSSEKKPARSFDVGMGWGESMWHEKEPFDYWHVSLLVLSLRLEFGMVVRNSCDLQLYRSVISLRLREKHGGGEEAVIFSCSLWAYRKAVILYVCCFCRFCSEVFVGEKGHLIQTCCG